MHAPACPYSGVSPAAWADAYDDALVRLPEDVEPSAADVLDALHARESAPREEDAFDARNERRSA